MKKILFGIGGLIVGAMLGGVVWVFFRAVLEALFTLSLAAGGAYLGYTYAKREELPPSDWKN